MPLPAWLGDGVGDVEQLVGQDHEAYERLTKMAQQARANEAQFLEHLILRAEAIYNFQPPVLLPPRPWWKLWSKEEREEVESGKYPREIPSGTEDGSLRIFTHMSCCAFQSGKNTDAVVVKWQATEANLCEFYPRS